MYQIAIFKIQPEPDSTGYQMNYPAGNGYLNTCCIANFLVLCVVWIRKYYSPWFTVLVIFVRLQNDLYCVGCGIKLYSLARLLFSALRKTS